MAEQTVATIKAVLRGDSSQLQQSLSQAQSSLNAFSNDAQQTGAKVDSTLGNQLGDLATDARVTGQELDDLAADIDSLGSDAQDMARDADKAGDKVSELGSDSKRASQDVQDVGKKAEQSASRLKAFGEEATKLGKSMSMKLTLPIVGVGVAAIKTAMDFESSMTKIVALVGVARSEVDAMSVSARQMAVEMGSSAKQAGEALFYITSAGLRGEVAMSTLEASLKATAIGLGDTATVADLATSALNAYGADVLSATNATDVMAATVREGKLETTELAGSMGRVLPLASAMGVRFDEVGAAFAALSRTGTNAAEAATQIRGILASLLRPTKQAEEALADMGLSSEQLRTQIREEGLLATLSTLADEFGNNEEAAALVFGNIRALSGVLDLMGANVQTTRDIFERMTDTSGAVAAAFEEVSQTTQAKLNAAMAEVKELLLSIGQDVLPTVRSALDTIASVVSTVSSAFESLPGPAQDSVLALAAVVAIAGPTLYAVGKMTTAVIALRAAMAGSTAASSGAASGLGSLLSVVKAHPAAFAASAAGAVAVGLVLKGLRDDAAAARERQEMLTQEMIDAGDPAATLRDRVDELAASLRDLAGDADDAGGEIETVANLIGDTTFAALLAEKGVTGAFLSVGGSIEDLVPLLREGTEEFDSLSKTTDTKAWRIYAKELSGVSAAFVETVAAAVDAGDITAIEGMRIFDALDETADAFDDAREEAEKLAREYFVSGQAMEDFGTTLGRDVLLEIVGAAEATGDYSGALERLESVAGDAVDMQSALADEYAYGEDEVWQYLAATRDFTDELSRSSGHVQTQEDRLRDLRREINLNAYELEKLRAAIEGEGMWLAMQEGISAAMEELASGTLTAEEHAAAVNAMQLEVVDYLIELGNVPSELATEITTAIADGDLDYVERQLAWLTRSRQIGVEVRLPSDSAWSEALKGFAQPQSGAFPFGAEGGIVRRPTWTLIGEAGPEALIPLSKMPGASPLPDLAASTGLSSGMQMNVTVNMPAGSDGAEVVRALQQYARRSGTLRVPTTGAVRQ